MNKVSYCVSMGLVVLFLDSAVWAKTVALWPIGYDAVSRECNLRSAIDQRDQLVLGDETELADTGLGWNVPSNPDTTEAALFTAVGGRCARASTVTETKNAILRCDAVGDGLARTLYPTNDYTVEGWIKFDGIPSNWWCIWNSLGGSTGTPGGHVLSFRQNGPAWGRWVLYVNGAQGGFANVVVNDVQFGTLIASQDCTNRWMHIALTFKYADPDYPGKSAWRFYINGVQYGGAITHAPLGAPAAALTKKVEIGGRSGNSARAVKTSFAYWRVSDACLQPDGFLNAGSGGTVFPAPVNHPTLAYWKLDKDAFGGISGAPAVGSVHLDGGLFDNTANAKSEITCCSDCAFADTPPNSAIAYPKGNAGSAYGAANEGRRSYLKAVGLGQRLTLADSFTVEGWFKPRRDRNMADQGGYLFATRASDSGWALQLCERESGYQLEVDAAGGSGTAISGDLTYWHEWSHVALVHTAVAGGTGTWTCYLDGVQCGSVASVELPSAENAPQDFLIGGSAEAEHSFFGMIDSVRVSGAALVPGQFLNATEDARPATDVLALYPLNALNGAYLDGTDLMGGACLAAARGAHLVAAATSEVPEIANPDTHPAFRGDPLNGKGSAGFRTFGGNYAYLLTQRDEIRSLFLQDAWTFEGYFRRSEKIGDDWEMIFTATASEPDLTYTSMMIGLTYRKSTTKAPNGGFILYADSICGLNDECFPGTDNQTMKIGEWEHVALTYEVDGKTCIWKLYLDGTYVSQFTGTLKTFYKPTGFILGGRPSSWNSFKGCISNVRLSKAALSPDKFLCAATESGTVVNRTLAYWSLDAAESSCDVSDRVTPFYHFDDLLAAVPQSDRARGHVPNPDATPSFVGDPRANHGSIRLPTANGRISAPNAGLKLDGNVEFTVEGWLKWAGAEKDGVEYVAGTFRTGLSAGWCLGVDHRGPTPKFSLFAKGALQTVVLDKCFDVQIEDLKGVWTHIALVYRPHAGNGTWTLFLNGEEKDSIENDWPLGDNIWSMHVFRIGTSDDARYSACVGSYDMWRVSQGALEPKDFLYRSPDGMLLLVR